MGGLFDDDGVECARPGEGNSRGSTPLAKVTENFYRPDCDTPLSPDQGRALWRKLRGNGFNPCSIKAGSKAPFGDEWGPRALAEGSAWTAEAPGIGLVCGGLDQNGKSLRPSRMA